MHQRKQEAFATTVVEPTDEGALAATMAGPDSPPVSARHSTDRWVGARLDHFSIERPLGRGGMGVVYLARDTSLDRPVAIKVLPDELAARPELQERFLREARAQARLRSPHVVAIYYIGRTPPPTSLYFAMELADGEPLEAVLEGGESVEPEQARRWMIEVARGLRDAHEAGIIHRDIKPSNLLRDRLGRVKIADFGLAKPLDGDTRITREGTILGSPLYMAPEQARGDAADHRSDMYSLGCTFFHLLAGSPAYDGPTPLAVVTRHITDPLPRLRDKAPAVPPPLAAVIERLMAKNPADRFASYEQVIVALERAAPEATDLAGVSTRAAALAVDCAIALALEYTLGWPALLLHVAYVTACHALTGQTLGKYLLRVRVVRVDGNPLGLRHAALRTAASLWLPFLVGFVILTTQGWGRLSAILHTFSSADLDAIQPLLIGLVVSNLLLVGLFLGGLGLAVVHPKKQALHDLVAGSQVVYQLRRGKRAAAA